MIDRGGRAEQAVAARRLDSFILIFRASVIKVYSLHLCYFTLGRCATKIGNISAVWISGHTNLLFM